MLPLLRDKTTYYCGNEKVTEVIASYDNLYKNIIVISAVFIENKALYTTL